MPPVRLQPLFIVQAGSPDTPVDMAYSMFFSCRPSALGSDVPVSTSHEDTWVLPKELQLLSDMSLSVNADTFELHDPLRTL